MRSRPSTLVRILPLKFFGVIPLYLGVEVILGITILNKAGGVYGFFSLITGHPINFWQWVYNFLCVAVLPVYVSSLMNVTTKGNTKKFSLCCITYVLDTIIGLFFTLHFGLWWYFTEGNVNYGERSGTSDSVAMHFKRANQIGSSSSQKYTEPQMPMPTYGESSLSRETFIILASTIVVTLFRLYFTLAIVSFTRLLLKQESVARRSSERNEVQAQGFEVYDEGDGWIAWIKYEFRHLRDDLEHHSKHLLDRYFAIQP